MTPRRRHERDDDRRHLGDRVRDELGRRRRLKVSRLEGNPAVVRGVIVAILSLLTTAGVGWAADVDAETIATLSTVIATLAPIAATLWTRFAVTPNAKVVARVSSSRDAVVAGDAAAYPTGREFPLDEANLPSIAVPVRLHPKVLEAGAHLEGE